MECVCEDVGEKKKERPREILRLRERVNKSKGPERNINGKK